MKLAANPMKHFALTNFIVALLLCLLSPACKPAITVEGGEWVAASNMAHDGFATWDEDGKAVGTEVQHVEEAAKLLGKTVRWVERPFPELFDALVNSEIDIAVANLGITEERSKRVSFSDHYFETEIVALVRPDSSLKKLSDLAGKRIGADLTTTSYAAARKQWPNAEIVGAATEGSFWPKMVDDGDIAAFVVDASDQERLETLSKISLRRLEEPLQAEYFGVAFPKGNPNWKAALDKAIAR